LQVELPNSLLIGDCRRDKLKSVFISRQSRGKTMPARSKARKTNARQNSRSGKDAIALLKQDHKNVKQLLKQLEAAEDGDERLQLFSQIENELKIHTQIEEEIFYPAFHQAAEGEEGEHLYYEAVEEHHVVDMVLPEMTDTDENSDEFAAKAKVLKDLVEHHAEEEETEMFPAARKLMDASELKDLGRQLEQRKQQLMTSTTGGRRKRAA
jgi:hemerythrin-like domain-containing protein